MNSHYEQVTKIFLLQSPTNSCRGTLITFQERPLGQELMILSLILFFDIAPFFPFSLISSR